MSPGRVLYAPNVHTGGGYVLLQSLLAAPSSGGGRLTAFLDERARARLALPSDVVVHWVRPAAGSRFEAERMLRACSRAGDLVLCFHGLPPVLPNPGRVVVFHQNRLLLDDTPLRQFALRTAVRLALERWIGRTFRHRVAAYVVQTPTMARDLARWFGSTKTEGAAPVIRVLPFLEPLPARPDAAGSTAPAWDFIYVSDGEAHKNHRCLLQAWQLLAEQGQRPRLALTLGPRDHDLVRDVQALHANSGVEVHNLGQLPRERVLQLYGESRALIFPSTSESFGLPLIEAQHLGLPILASELDYVRDVCSPVQTFDPRSPLSIARAVRRFLAQPEPPLAIGRPADFWLALLPLDAPDTLQE